MYEWVGQWIWLTEWCCLEKKLNFYEWLKRDTLWAVKKFTAIKFKIKTRLSTSLLKYVILPPWKSYYTTIVIWYDKWLLIIINRLRSQIINLMDDMRYYYWLPREKKVCWIISCYYSLFFNLWYVFWSRCDKKLTEAPAL